PAPEGIRRCEQLLAEIGDHRIGEAVILNHLAGLYAMQGRVDDARGRLARGCTIPEDMGGTIASAVAQPGTFVALLTGDAPDAEARLRLAYETLRQMGERAYLATTAALLARAIEAQGRAAEAEPFAEVSRDAAASDDVSAQIAWRSVLARILSSRRRHVEA